MSHYRETMSPRSWRNSKGMELGSNRKDLVPRACLPNLFVVFPSLPGKKIKYGATKKGFTLFRLLACCIAIVCLKLFVTNYMCS